MAPPVTLVKNLGFILITLTLFTCQGWFKNDNQAVIDEWEHLSDDELFEDYDDDYDEYDEDFENYTSQPAGITSMPMGVNVDDYGLPHPGASSEEATRQILMVFQRPADNELVECHEEFLQLARQSLSGDSLVDMMHTSASAVARNRYLYHWCFYFSMMSLDQYLKGSINTVTMKQRLDTYLERMRALWIIAQSLEKGVGEKEYFYYLRIRYKELSRQYFARQLEVISHPIGHGSRGRPNAHSKPAGEYVDEE